MDTHSRAGRLSIHRIARKPFVFSWKANLVTLSKHNRNFHKWLKQARTQTIVAFTECLKGLPANPLENLFIEHYNSDIKKKKKLLQDELFLIKYLESEFSHLTTL